LPLKFVIEEAFPKLQFSGQPQNTPYLSGKQAKYANDIIKKISNSEEILYKNIIFENIRKKC
jgi:hypothetical protein